MSGGYLTPGLWVDVTASTYRDVLGAGVGTGTLDVYGDEAGMSYAQLLSVTVGGNDVTLSEFDVRSLSDGDEHLIFTDFNSPFADITIVFNNSLVAPGFDIVITGLLDAPLDFLTMNLLRRDPTGRYPDQFVRGVTDVSIYANNIRLTDYEAPLNVSLEYYLLLENGDGTFLVGPILPTPLPYIPTLNEAYGQGTCFIKNVDVPELSLPVQISEGLDEWSTPGRIKAEHTVLDRKFDVTITGPLSGREGSFKIACFLDMGQSYESVEALFASGATLLIQNPNPVYSAFKDFYIKIKSAAFKRLTRMVIFGSRDNPPTPQVYVTVDVAYKEVDRPDPSGVIVVNNTWQAVKDSLDTWQDVKVFADGYKQQWLDVMKIEAP